MAIVPFHKLDENANTLLCETKKSSDKMLSQWGYNPGLSTFDSKSGTLLSTLTQHLLVSTEILGSLGSHVVLILTKSSKFKYQVVHE